MKIGHTIDANGFLTGDVLEDSAINPDVTILCDDRFNKPKWDGSSWIEGINSEELLTNYKQNKIDVLTGLKDAELVSGFTFTNTTGTTFYFGYNSKDQEYFHKKATMITIDPTITSVDWKTSVGMATFSREDFIKIIQAGDKHEETLVYKLLNLEALIMNVQVNATTTIEQAKAQIDVIVW